VVLRKKENKVSSKIVTPFDGSINIVRLLKLIKLSIKFTPEQRFTYLPKNYLFSLKKK